ncbi:MAG TPA: lipoprotein signal peptidase [Chromatiales bacterium]|nr:lipoprotein signal peptidase [Thiotrichales bacterium]HIP69326.1 lipoprotein signal peptidase [Chromatiales bacterium]
MLKWLWLSVVVIVLDQVSKLYIDQVFTLYQQKPIIDGFFNLTLAYNKGAAFSFLADENGWQRWLFTGLAVIVSGVIFYWLKGLNKHEKITAISLSLILGGAIGNVIDRIAYGHVIDFLDFHYQQYHYPAFNIADSAITIGAALLIFHTLFGKHEDTD